MAGAVTLGSDLLQEGLINPMSHCDRWLTACTTACLAGVLACTGCVKNRPAVEGKPIATDIDPATAQPQYWFDKPATATIAGGDYDRLLAQCESSIAERRFTIDRRDYRDGIIASAPLISKQCWEFWRGDVVTTRDLEQSSLGTYRRTVRWKIDRNADGTFVAAPKVVVERFVGKQQRITTVVNYRQTLSNAEAMTQITPGNLKQVGVESWYAIGRDEALEKQLVADVRERAQK